MCVGEEEDETKKEREEGKEACVGGKENGAGTGDGRGGVCRRKREWHKMERRE